MKGNIIFDTKTNSIIAICKDHETAHLLAESYSYVVNGNSWYGLFGIQLVSDDQVDRDVTDRFDSSVAA